MKFDNLLSMRILSSQSKEAPKTGTSAKVGDIPVVCATEHVSKRCREAVGKRIESVIHLASVTDVELVEFDRMISRCRYCPQKQRKDDPERIHRALRDILPKMLKEAEADMKAEKYLRARLEVITESFFLLYQNEHVEGAEDEALLTDAKSHWLNFLSKGVPQKF